MQRRGVIGSVTRGHPFSGAMEIQASRSDPVFCYSHHMAFPFGPAEDFSLPGRSLARSLVSFRNRLDRSLPLLLPTRR